MSKMFLNFHKFAKCQWYVVGTGIAYLVSTPFDAILNGGFRDVFLYVL